MIILKRFKYYCIKFRSVNALNDLTHGIFKVGKKIISIANGKKSGPYLEQDAEKIAYREYKNDLLDGVSIFIEKYGVDRNKELPTKVTRYANHKRGVFHGRCIMVPPARYSFYEYGKDYYIYCDYNNGYTSRVKVVHVRDDDWYNGKKVKRISVYSYVADTCINIFKDEFYDHTKYSPIPTFREEYIFDKLHVSYEKHYKDVMTTECKFKRGRLIYYKNIDKNVYITYEYDNTDDLYDEKLKILCTIKLGEFYTTQRNIAEYNWDKKANEFAANIAILPSACQVTRFEFEDNEWKRLKSNTNKQCPFIL